MSVAPSRPSGERASFAREKRNPLRGRRGAQEAEAPRHEIRCRLRRQLLRPLEDAIAEAKAPFRALYGSPFAPDDRSAGVWLLGDA